MNKIQCSEGHFYDADLYSQCPLCEKMESVGKVNSSKPSKKSLISKKKNQETKNVPEQSENIQRKSSNQPKKKRNAPAAGSVVTVAFYNTGTEDGKQPDNQGILDEDGHLVLKEENKKRAKKEEQKEDYITAAEIIEEKEKKNQKKEEEQEPISQQEEPLVKVKEEEETESDLDVETDNEQEEMSKEEETETADDESADSNEKNNISVTDTQDETEETDASRGFDAQQIHSEKNIVSTATNGGSKTVGFYHFDTDPVVGWVVCLSGDIKGKSFKLKSGQNIIGTSGIMDIYLPSEDKSTEAKALLIFEPNKKEYILRSRSSQISVNDKEIKEYSKIKDYDILTVCGYKLVFKSLCNKGFDWKDYE